NVTTRAFIGQDTSANADPAAAAPGSTNIHAQGNVQVAATEASKVLGIDGSLSAAGAVAAGAAAAVPIMTKTTEAFLGKNAIVTALAQGGTMKAQNGHFTIDSTAYTQIDEKDKDGNVTKKSVGPDASGQKSLPDNAAPGSNARLSSARMAKPATTSL